MFKCTCLIWVMASCKDLLPYLGLYLFLFQLCRHIFVNTWLKIIDYLIWTHKDLHFPAKCNKSFGHFWMRRCVWVNEAQRWKKSSKSFFIINKLTLQWIYQHQFNWNSTQWGESDCFSILLVGQPWSRRSLYWNRSEMQLPSR